MTAFVSGGFAASASLPIDILNKQFTTIVSLASYYPDLVSGVLSNDVRETISPVPTSSSLYNYRSGGGLVAETHAGLTDISAYTSITYDGYVKYSSATTKSEIWFTPLSSETATINMAFLGEHFWFYSQGSLSLTDVTSGEQIWNYGWAGPGPGTVPWQVSEGIATASITIDTDFNAADTYYLSMSTQTAAQGDSEFIQVQVFGLEPIPEPSTAALGALAIALAATLSSLRKHRNAAPDRHI